MSYLIPAPYTGMSSWAAHQRRNPPSGEPGTDYYMPIGTPLRAPFDGRVVGIGGGIAPATGRFLTMDDGVRWVRFLHLREWRVSVGQTFRAGDVVAISGASGYGSEYFGASSPNDPTMLRNTGGPHVHVTAFKGRAYTFGASGTVDFHALTGGAVAGDGSQPFGGFLMALSDKQQQELYDAVRNLYAATFVGGPSMEDAGRPIQRSLDLMHRELREVNSRLDPISRPDDDGVMQSISVRQELADAKTIAMRTEAKTDELISRPAVSITAEQVKMIADAVIAAGGEVDYERIANEVRAKFTEEPLK